MLFKEAEFAEVMVQEEVSAMLVRLVRVVHESASMAVAEVNATTTAVGKCMVALKIG